MKKLLAVLSVGALAALITPTAAHAQSLNDIPEVGPQICTEWQNQLDEFEGQAQDAGTPFAELHAGAQQLHDAACGSDDGGGDEPAPPDDGGDDANPLCEPLEQIAAGAEEQPSPGPEFAAGLREIAAAIGCPAPDGDEPPSDDGGEEPGPHCTVLAEIITGMQENEAPAELISGFQQIHDGAGCATDEGGGGDDDDTTTTTAPPGDDDTEVAGAIEAAQTGGGTATPATGGGLLAGSIGLGLVGLASVGRRFFGTT